MHETPELIRSLGVLTTDDLLFRVCNSMLTEAVLAADEGRWVSYSRNRSFYSEQRRYLGTAYSCDRVVVAIDYLRGLGLIEEDRMPKGNLGRQSIFRATQKLLNAWVDGPIRFDPCEIIELKDYKKDGKKKRIGYADTDLTRRMRRQLAANSEFASTFLLELPPGEGITKTDRHLMIDGRYYRLDTGLRRIFNEQSFSKGGRAYANYQNIPKPHRPNLLLNGETIAEPDFKALHPAMAYNRRGKLLDFDAYETGTHDRKDGKLAFQVLLNATSRNKAHGALLKSDDRICPASQINRLLDDMINLHKGIKDDLHRGLGLDLQRIDSDIAMDVMTACRREDIAALPVHDSFITGKRDQGRVAEIMEASYAKRFTSVNSCEVRVFV